MSATRNKGIAAKPTGSKPRKGGFGSATTNEPMNDGQRLGAPTEGRDWDASAAEDPVDTGPMRGKLDGEQLGTDVRPRSGRDDFADVEHGRDTGVRGNEEHLTDETEDRE